ncbi:hypothetical protein HanPSC8_Chr14g0598421 [Helianthus annuus]|nr:hypothetical protein HanPSC8_Chr14g0598421 [Helianthus annuus]
MGLGLGLRFGAWPLWRGFEAVGRASKVTWRDLNGHVSTHAPNPSPTIPHGREFFFPFHVLTNAQPKPHHTPQSKLNACSSRAGLTEPSRAILLFQVT